MDPLVKYKIGAATLKLATLEVYYTPMKQNPNHLLQEALKLPPEGRAALAGALLDSLDQEVDQDAETAWEAEIGRRLRDLDSGTVRPMPWSEARGKISGR